MLQNTRMVINPQEFADARMRGELIDLAKKMDEDFSVIIGFMQQLAVVPDRGQAG